MHLADSAARRQVSEALRAQALRMGFVGWGVARAERLSEIAEPYSRWLAEGRHGEMSYLATDLDTRLDPRRLLEGCECVIVLSHPYLTDPDAARRPLEPPEGVPKIARYAHGLDYHHTLRRKLHTLGQLAQGQALAAGLGELAYRACVDSAPLDERAWARRTGLGWQGKNTLILHPEQGSYFFLAVLLLTLELPTEGAPLADHCGTCTRCLDACPTQALTPYQIDATRCLSYHTIELKGHAPDAYRPHTEGWAFGCDICQEVCPWNKFAPATDEPDFAPAAHSQLSTEQWRALSPSQHKKLTRPTPLSRIRRDKWLDNLDAATEAP